MPIVQKEAQIENRDSDVHGKHFSIFRPEEITILAVDTMSLIIRRSRLAPCPDTRAG